MRLFPFSLSRMLKKSASGVLASLRGSTYRSVRLASSLAAALLDGLFEHPDVFVAVAPSVIFHRCLCVNRVFPQPVRDWTGRPPRLLRETEAAGSCSGFPLRGIEEYSASR